MRAIWKGAVSFGLVSVPVKLYAATESHDVSFRQVHAKDGGRIKYQRVCSIDGEEVDYADIAKGYETEDGEMVILTEDYMAALPSTSSREISVEKFVPSDQIDPLLFDKSYYLEPENTGKKPYALLREAIRNTGTVGIGKITMRTNSLHLAGVKAVGDAIVLEIMRFGNELVDVGDFSFPSDAGVRPQELNMATQLVENLSTAFDPTKYTDDYHQNLMKIIKAKMKGKKIEVEEPEEPETTQVVDLMARLQESLDMGKRGGRRASSEGRKPPTRAKRASRRKSA